MEKVSGKWALVTGASSGFGQDFASLLAERGYDLVLVARRAAPMEALAKELRSQHRVQVSVIAQDLASAAGADALIATLAEQNIQIHTLINNAGFGVFGEFTEQPYEKTEEMLQLNMMSLTRLTYGFARQMQQRGEGQILLVASIGGYQATPFYAAYAASKAYVLLLGEALNVEMAKYGVKVSVLSPGITATGFLDVSGQKATLYQRLMMMQSRPVAEIGLRAMFAGKPSVIPGIMNKLTIFSNRFAPRWLQAKIAASLMKN